MPLLLGCCINLNPSWTLAISSRPLGLSQSNVYAYYSFYFVWRKYKWIIFWSRSYCLCLVSVIVVTLLFLLTNIFIPEFISKHHIVNTSSKIVTIYMCNRIVQWWRLLYSMIIIRLMMHLVFLFWLQKWKTVCQHSSLEHVELFQNSTLTSFSPCI